jgi:hypothetical protein
MLNNSVLFAARFLIEFRDAAAVVVVDLAKKGPKAGVRAVLWALGMNKIGEHGGKHSTQEKDYELVDHPCIYSDPSPKLCGKEQIIE